MTSTAGHGAAERWVDPDGLRDAIEGVLAGAGRVSALFAARAGDALEARYVCDTPGGDVVLRCPAPAAEVPSVIDLLPRLEWDEREARDLYGLRFAGHEPHRPLVHHPRDLAEWTTPVRGDDVHQVAVGPVHAGVIESGHFRFHTVGERIIHLDARLFHKHRGLERMAEERPADEALATIGRSCAACAVANAVAVAQAVEGAMGLWPDDGLRRARTLLAELERLYNHLNDIGAICAGVGLAPGTMTFAALKERAQRTIGALVGHRFMFGTVAVGASHVRIDAAAATAARDALRELGDDASRAWRALLFDASLRDRTRGAGVLTTADARRLGTVGPSGRASGLVADARERSPRLLYRGFRPAVPPEPVGDVAARLETRALELGDTFAILDEILAAPVEPACASAAGGAGIHGVGRVESPRGETVCAVELDGDMVRRVHLRTSSYANWPAVTRASAGANLPDFPLINKSFELCYACVDR